MAHSQQLPVALITGAAKRIGAAIAQQLHQQGYQVALHCNQSLVQAQALANTLNQHRSNSAIVVQADLLQQSDLQAMVKTITDHFGRLDLLVNNASSFYPTAIGDVTEADWNDLLGSNLKAPFFLSQLCQPYLKQHQGSIINITDIHGERPMPGFAVYSIAKAGLIQMTKALAKELAPEIRVNAVSPGAILWPEAQTESDEIAQQKTLDKIALGRLGEEQDIANTVLFLAKHSPYITGQVIAVDGGRTLTI